MDVRLPSHLTPLHYRVSLVPFIIPNNFTIKGSVTITFEATLDGANNITVHTAETNITHDSGTETIFKKIHEKGHISFNLMYSLNIRHI